jgi:hypothetical protein
MKNPSDGSRKNPENFPQGFSEILARQTGGEEKIGHF